MLKLVMGRLNWVIGILEVVGPTLVDQKKEAELSVAIFVGILVVVLVFYRHKILFNSIVGIRELCARTLVAEEKVTTISMEAVKLNDSVYQVHKPESEPNLQVLFFHGLLLRDSAEMHLSTWQSDDGCIWPKTWLPEEFPDAQILVVSYVEGLKKGCAESFNMHNISENLINDLMQAGIGQKPYCPVVLVGHSFGGLVKKLCLQAYKTPIRDSGESDVKNFLESIRGIFYYSTPHRGSDHIDKAEKVLKGPLFKYFKTLSTGAAKLNQKFDNLRNSLCQKWQIEGLGEGCKVKSGLFKGCVVVPEASARDVDKFNLESTADHFSICRPKDKTSRRFKNLITLIHSIDDKMKEEKKTQDGIRKKEEAMAVKRSIRQDLQDDVLNRKVIGIEIRLKEVQSRLEKFNILGLTGMGGVGKSTLAKVVFNEVCHAFEYTCFINEVKSKGVQCNLEAEVWTHMHHNGRRVGDTEDWSDLRGKSLLLVLDDILGDRDVTFLSNKANLCSAESRFIVTTRDSDKVLKSLEDMDIDIYEVPFLDRENSKELLMTKAFSKEELIPEVVSVMEEIVRKCDGLPLTLTVIGSYLRMGKREDKEAYVERWTQTVNALDQAEQVTPINERLWAKLRLSYDSLGEKEKQIFLDATTFFYDRSDQKPWTLRDPKVVWRKADINDKTEFFYYTFHDNWSPEQNAWTLREAKAAWRKAYITDNEMLLWDTLVDRCLVYNVGEDSQIRIHEQLLSLGRKIAFESENNGKIRVWGETMCQVSTLLQNNDKSENKEFHALKLAEDITIPDHALHRLKKLQYLEANFSRCRVGKSLPSELVLLKCRGLEHLQAFLPADLRGRLAVLQLLEVNSLPSYIGQCSSLRIFRLELSKPPKPDKWVDKFVRKYNRRLNESENLQIIPSEIGDLQQLEYLTLMLSSQVQSLPETFGNLSNLRDLKIYASRALHSLPKSFGHLASLKRLLLYVCTSLVALPDSFGDLSSLEHLELRNCNTLSRLSDSFGNLSRLKHLQIYASASLNALPESFGNLNSLEHLELEDCQFEALPESFGDLSSLEHLELRHCKKLHRLCDSFGNLSRLKHLRIYVSASLNALPGSFGKLSALEHLEFQDCIFEVLPDSFGDLSSLERLELRDCSRLCRLPDSFGHLSKLKHLLIHGCNSLSSLPDSFGKLSALEHLELSYSRFEAIPKSFGQLLKLTHPQLVDSFGNGVAFIPSGQLRKLQYLRISGRYDGILNLHMLPESIGELKALDHRILLQIGIFKSIPNCIKSMQSLKNLELGQLPFGQDLPSWLGENYVDPLTLSKKVFHVQDSGFTLASEETGTLLQEKWTQSLQEKAVEMVDKSDCERALQYLSPYNLGELQPRYQGLLLRERGIVKRFKGDLHGALEDLTSAVGVLSEADDSLYDCWKHRGYVNFLLGRLDDAEQDGAMALNLLPDNECDNLIPRPFFKEPTTTSTLGEKSVTYMGFRLGKRLGFKLDELSELMDSVHSQVMEKVRESDFEKALAWWDVIGKCALSSAHKILFLQERGVLMRLAGDFYGALKDLTAALEIYGKAYDIEGYRSQAGYFAYNCWKHRGLVNFLLGDLDRAQKDGATALRVRHCQLKEEQKFRWEFPGFPSDELEMPSSLGEELVKYMHFRLAGLTDPGDRGRLYSSREKVEEKLRASDFSGALAIWDAVDVDGKVSCLSEWFIFLLQRGTLKRLAGDLHGALGDLTTALEIVGYSEDLTTAYKSLNLPVSLLYECLKQRGFVNYLLGDLNGAHKNGTMALKDTKFNPVYSEAADGDRYTFDRWKHRGYVKFLLEAQDEAKRDSAMVLTTGSYQAMNVAGVASSSVGEESVTYYRATYQATYQACQKIGARELDICWGDNASHWEWCHRYGSRSAEVAYLKGVSWLEVNGKWQGHLSPGAYTLYWRLGLPQGGSVIIPDRMGPVEFSFEATGNEQFITECYLTRLGAETSRELSEEQQQPLGYRLDLDAWMELDVGNFMVESEDILVEITFSMKEIKSGLEKANLYVDGVVICPSSTIQNTISLSNAAGVVPPSVGEEESVAYQATSSAAVVSASVGEDLVIHQSTEAACQRIGARELSVVWGDNASYWEWCPRQSSRFAEVAYLKNVWWLEVNGRWQGHLSPGAYTLSWRLCLPAGSMDKMGPVKFSFEAAGNVPFTTQCYLSPHGARTSRELTEGQQQPLGYRLDRGGWMELDLDNFTVESEDLPVDIEFSMKDIESGMKSNLYLDGVVICPSSTIQNRLSLSNT